MLKWLNYFLSQFLDNSIAFTPENCTETVKIKGYNYTIVTEADVKVSAEMTTEHPLLKDNGEATHDMEGHNYQIRLINNQTWIVRNKKNTLIVFSTLCLIKYSIILLIILIF